MGDDDAAPGAAAVLPVSGEGDSAYEPIWADDVARCVVADLAAATAVRGASSSPGPSGSLRPDRPADRPRGGPGPPAGPRPVSLVHLGLAGLRRTVGDAAFATWEEAELMEVPMVSERGTADAEALGIEPRRMSDVLGA